MFGIKQLKARVRALERQSLEAERGIENCNARLRLIFDKLGMERKGIGVYHPSFSNEDYIKTIQEIYDFLKVDRVEGSGPKLKKRAE